MPNPTVFGPTYSTYVRTTRLALAEKEVAYDLVDVAMLQGAHQQPAFLERNPFGKVPAFEHDGLGLYETGAITRYVDRAFPGPALQPTDPRHLARMDQIMGIVDSFAYGPIVGKLVWQRMVTPMMGGKPDDGIVAEAIPHVARALAEVATLMEGGPFFAGPSLSLADLYLMPVFAYFASTPEGPGLVGVHPPLVAWWSAASARPSMAATDPQFG
ncbi:MAG: glutathione S-transferase family protein [Gemmatimonadaceae bacterium]|nr:glutathione S-transferase family protein [Acetobacteraceae bacterium]